MGHRIRRALYSGGVLYPPVSTASSLETYNAVSYLKIPYSSANSNYNSGITSCSNYLPDGLQKGAKYIFRYKARGDSNGAPSGSYVAGSKLVPYLGEYEIDSGKKKAKPSGGLIGSIATISDPERQGATDWYYRLPYPHC